MPDLLETRIENRAMVQPNRGNTIGTAHISQVDFRRPVEIGDVAHIEAYVYAAGRTSVRTRIRAAAEAD